MNHKILVVKESAPGEKRVSLIPEDVKILSGAGYEIYIESGAGVAAGFSDADYASKGAKVRDNHDNYESLFKDISVIVRAKRPSTAREKLENQALKSGTIMIGALDPFLADGHIDAYNTAGIMAYSIDQLSLSPDSPMNILAVMSKMAGELAFEDAYQKSRIKPVTEVLIVGTGTAGLAALQAARERGLNITLFSTNINLVQQESEQRQTKAIHIDKSAPISDIQDKLLQAATNASIIITSARRAGEKAPLLFPTSTLNAMHPGCCIVDLALSEGGNVEGSQHDKTLTLGNNVLVTNVSGYPKVKPREASLHWSLATRLFIEALDSDDIQEAKIAI